MMNYTEGPWTWENYHDTHTALIRIANLKPGDKRTVLFHAAAWEILPADKNLIQAAPDMYEALKAYIEHVERFHGESGYPGNRCEWCLDREKEMRQALAKAEGKEG